ncbi:hypothetical protein LINPERHAP2_LOCUS25232 [Linum perenne]
METEPPGETLRSSAPDSRPAAQPNTDSMPRKRARDLPSPSYHVSDLDRPSPVSTESSSRLKQTPGQDPNAKMSYRSAAGATRWLVAENVDNLPLPMQSISESQDSNPRCPRIPFSEDEIKALYKPWSKALIVKVSDMSNSYFLFRFADEEDYTRPAFEGPWKIYDYYITVAQWSPAVNEEEPIKSILTWVRLPKLPIHYFNSMAVHRIGNFIGKTVRLDLATSEGARCRYASVCVEVDLTKPLLGKYMLEDRIFKIEYESLENLCFDCGHYGHKREACKPPAAQLEEPSPEINIEAEKTDDDVGEWMTVQRRNNRRATKTNSVASVPKEKGSMFSVLQQPTSGQKTGPSEARVEAPAPESTPVSEEDEQLAKLKKVLDTALKGSERLVEAANSSQTKQVDLSRMALKDISND